ncbi:MAG: T9SS C-terminal target domain-containing protein [Ignavibacteriales bacterium]|nr:MAG: T9SS C-terminal target domain-containing protein [Ignavibacteriales bacterium]
MKNLFWLLFIYLAIYIYPQKIPTTLGEVRSEIKFDFSQTAGRVEGIWQGKQSMPYPRYYGASVAYTLGDTTWLYVFGGDTTGFGDSCQTALRYNLISDSWEYIDSMPVPMRVNAASRLGDKLYTMGGFAGYYPDSALKTLLEYDVNTKAWRQLPDMPEGIIYHKAFGYQDSLIFIIGGVTFDSTYFRSNVLLYNINTQTFREALPLPEPRANFALVVKDNTFYISGGFFSKDSISDKTIIGTINPLNHSSISYTVLSDSVALYPVPVHSNYGYPYGTNKINFFGGSSTTLFNPVNNSYVLTTPENIFNSDTVANVPFTLMAFHSGYEYTPVIPGTDSLLRVIVAGGVSSGTTIISGTWVYTDSNTVTGIKHEDILPEGFSLEQNYPNPFNPSTTIKFSLPLQSYVILEVFNALGEKISTLLSEVLSAGTYSYNFDISSINKRISSGTYFYRLRAGEFTETKKILFIK